MVHVVSLQRLAGDGRGPLEPTLAVIAGRQRSGLVQHVDEYRGAELGQRRRGDRVRLEQLLGFVDDELQALGVGHGRLALAAPAEDQRLEPLRSHHGPEAPTPDGPAAVVHDAAEQHAALAGRADHGGLRLRVQLAHARQRLRHVETPEVRGGAQHRTAVAVEGLSGLRSGDPSVAVAVQPDGHVAGRVERAADDQVVPAQTTQRVAPIAAGVAVEDGPGERRATGDAVAAARRSAGPRERARREDQQILGSERLHVEQPLAERQVRAEPAPAEIGAGDGDGQLLFAARPPGEVETQTAEGPQD